MSKKRILIYFICLLLFVALIIVKQKQVRSSRNRPIISTFSEWQQNGKPVFVKRVLLKNVSLFEKLTLRPVGNEVFEGYVSKATQEKLAIGQDIYAESDSNNIIGSISEISKNISLDTGMFYVKAVFKKSVDVSNWLVVYVHINTLFNVICVPNTIIVQEDNQHVLWIVTDGYARKRTVAIKRHDGYGAVIAEGLEAGDYVVTRGFTQLSDNDKVNILDNTDFKEIRSD